MDGHNYKPLAFPQKPYKTPYNNPLKTAISKNTLENRSIFQRVTTTTRLKLVEADNREALFDIDSPEDYESLQKL
jgi:hypothetical protein